MFLTLSVTATLQQRQVPFEGCLAPSIVAQSAPTVVQLHTVQDVCRCRDSVSGWTAAT